MKLENGLKIKRLVFNHINDSNGFFGWICCIKGFGSDYGIYIDRRSGKVTVSGLDYKKTEHPSIADAKRWCQQDFENKVIALFEDERFGKWKESNDFDGKMSDENAFEIWSNFDEEDK